MNFSPEFVGATAPAAALPCIDHSAMWHGASFAVSPLRGQTQNDSGLDSSLSSSAIMNNMIQAAMQPSFSTPPRAHDVSLSDFSSGRKRAHPDGLGGLVAPSPIPWDTENTLERAKRVVPGGEQQGGAGGEGGSFLDSRSEFAVGAAGKGGEKGTVLSRMHLVARPTPLSRDRMREYLADPEALECGVSLFHAKVAQKSYAKEKRFFCPPPSVYLRGSGWEKKRERVDGMYREARAAMLAAGEMDKEEIRDEQVTGLCTSLGIGGGQEPHLLTFGDHTHENTDFASVKTATIPDSDKRRYFELQLQMIYACGLHVGTFPSTRIKVISKPSKKKQSLKNTDCKFLCIQGDGKVALFNRPKSNFTRYMHVTDEGDFVASPTKWAAMTMHIVQDDPLMFEQQDRADDLSFTVREGFVHYGDEIKLVDTTTGNSLPKMRIRKVVANPGPLSPSSSPHLVLLDPATHDEPVSQLHKCALQLLDDELSFLWMSHDKVLQGKAKPTNNPSVLEISDGAGWTIISVDAVDYRFFESAGPVREPLTPAPRLLSFEVMGPLEQQRLVLTGRGFTHSLKVWLHTVELDTVIRGEEMAMASLPSFEEMMKACPGEEIDNEELAISFVRDDGVVYRASQHFTYHSYRRAAPTEYGNPAEYDSSFSGYGSSSPLSPDLV